MDNIKINTGCVLTFLYYSKRTNVHIGCMYVLLIIFGWSLGVVVLSIHVDVGWLVSLSILVLPRHSHIHQHSDHTHTSIHDIIGDSTTDVGVVHSKGKWKS